MKDSPLVSVIIPCYNASAYIEEALDSICKQTYLKLEIIVVNDGSADNTEAKVLAFSDARIRYFKQENKGQCAASNLGLRQSKGDYIKFFDADDIINPAHIEEQLKRLDEKTDSVASCAWGRFYDGNPASAVFKSEKVWKDMNPLIWLKTALSQRADMMGAWLWLIPRPLIEKVGGWDERLSLNNDFEFSIRLLLQAKQILFTPDAKVYYRSGLESALSQNASEEKYKAAFLSTQLGCSYLLQAEESSEMKLICANRYQEWVYRLYPHYTSLIDEMEKQIKDWGGSNKKIEGGKMFRILDYFFGWRKAKRIRIFFYRLGYSKLLKLKS